MVQIKFYPHHWDIGWLNFPPDGLLAYTPGGCALSPPIRYL